MTYTIIFLIKIDSYISLLIKSIRRNVENWLRTAISDKISEIYFHYDNFTTYFVVIMALIVQCTISLVTPCLRVTRQLSSLDSGR